MKLKHILFILTVFATVISLIGANENFTWWLEAFPVILGVIVLIIFRKFQSRIWFTWSFLSISSFFF